MEDAPSPGFSPSMVVFLQGLSGYVKNSLHDGHLSIFSAIALLTDLLILGCWAGYSMLFHFLLIPSLLRPEALPFPMDPENELSIETPLFFPAPSRGPFPSTLKSF